jgi:MFS superfamily sulfate permease-like transporter
VPGIYGLYATIIPLLAYALFGPAASWCWGRIRRWRR